MQSKISRVEQGLLIFCEANSEEVSPLFGLGECDRPRARTYPTIAETIDLSFPTNRETVQNRISGIGSRDE
jgi:hypothetical protein